MERKEQSFSHSSWVLLYSAQQDAYHIETRDEYDSRPSNGYRLLEVTRTYEEAAEKLWKRQGI